MYLKIYIVNIQCTTVEFISLNVLKIHDKKAW